MQSRFFLLLSALLLLAVAAADADPKAKAKANPMDGQLGSESTKGGDKMAGYPKKANSGKKRPTKTPTTAAADGAGNATDATALSDDFKNLGGDDLEFIAAVEKQFSMYGGKLKFKIEHDNATDPKNPKRTVDGELGYGYSQEGYEYRKPAFMFYPYSQKDIAADAPGYYGGGSVGHGGHAGGGSVTVQSSYSYELQPQTYEVQGQPQLDVPATSAQAYQAPTGGAEGEPGHQQQHYEEPVIVLRIPGPTKYAAHLQALLQQYLQIRATQYLQILENAAHKDEYQQQQGGGQLLQQAYQDEGAASPGQQQQYAEQQYGHEQQEVVAQQHDEAAPPSAPQHPSYEEHAASGATSPQHQPYEVPQYDQASHDYQQEISAHPGLSGAHPPPYPDIGDVYQGYKDRHAHLQHHLQHQQQAAHHHIAGTHVEEAEYCPETDFHGPAVTESAPSFYFPHDHAHHFQHDHAHHFQHGSRLSTSVTDSYQPFVLFSMSTPIYDSPADGGPHLATHHGHAYGPEAHLNSYDHQLHTSENNPRPTHTQVLFTPKRGEEGATDNESMYALPSIRPHERHPAAPQPSQPFYPPQHPHQHQHPQRRPQQQQPHPQHFQQQHLQQQHVQQQHLQPQHLQQPRPFQKQQFQQQQLQQQQLQQQVLQQQQHEAPQSPSSEEVGQQQPISSAAPAPQNGVLLDQKSFNYHAHPARRRTRNNTKRESSQAVESTHFGDKINAKKSAKTGAEAQ